MPLGVLFAATVEVTQVDQFSDGGLDGVAPLLGTPGKGSRVDWIVIRLGEQEGEDATGAEREPLVIEQGVVKDREVPIMGVLPERAQGTFTPLLELCGRQRVRRFSNVVGPPRLSGMMWSTVKSRCVPHSRHR